MSLTLEIVKDEQVLTLEVGEVVAQLEPLHPGVGDMPAGTITDSVTWLYQNTPRAGTTPTVADLEAVSTTAQAAVDAVNGFSAELEGYTNALDGLGDDVSRIDDKLANINVSSLQSNTLNADERPTLTYENGDTKVAGFKVPKGYRGTATATPTVEGAAGDFFLNTNAATDVVGWWCTAAGAAGAAVWTPRGGKVFAPMVFDVDANRNYHHQAPSAWVMEAPAYYGALAAGNVVWEYTAAANWTGWAAVAAWPLQMAAGSTLRARVTGLASGAAGGASLRRLS